MEYSRANWQDAINRHAKQTPLAFSVLVRIALNSGEISCFSVLSTNRPGTEAALDSRGTLLVIEELSGKSTRL
ncbi:MAG: hypothetical protein K0U86_23780 [Planctomycetes bacterium]|nr:hypothetical protein [Planctomycetota bacterium]MCH9727934.1 hypothetical protein [Planctomycetota bacterium]MCH9778369.1 hypothetical protein [Planctomycetota bacterium]MCH9790324.1 hypothetical protein [Planctomycetota bacterium]MDF1742888.1 hypothetical protein [Gimesia sp.]